MHAGHELALLAEPLDHGPAHTGHDAHAYRHVCERAMNAFARSAGFSRMKVPFATSSSQSRSYSACEPSHQTTSAGLVWRARLATHCRNSLWRTHSGAVDGAFMQADSRKSKAQRSWAGALAVSSGRGF